MNVAPSYRPAFIFVIRGANIAFAMLSTGCAGSRDDIECLRQRLPCHKFERRLVHLLAPFQKTHINAALAIIEAAAPKDEIEGALAVQMACTHTAAMAVLAKLDVAFATEQRVVAFGSAAARLMRAYATQKFNMFVLSTSM